MDLLLLIQYLEYYWYLPVQILFYEIRFISKMVIHMLNILHESASTLLIEA